MARSTGAARWVSDIVAGSDVALEIRQRDGDRRLVLERDEACLEVDPGPKPSRPGKTPPSALTTGERSVRDADQCRIQTPGDRGVGAEQETGWIADDGDITPSRCGEHSHDRPSDRSPKRTIEYDYGEGRRGVEPRLLT